MLGLRTIAALCAAILGTAALLAGSASGEQASDPISPAAAQLDVGGMNFSCAIVAGGQVRCWGYGADGELGYPGVTSVGVSDTPASVGPVDIGAGYTATAISSGEYHTCVIRNDGSVLCWGYGADGRLGYDNTNDVGETQTPAAAGPVDLGGHTATAITAGDGFTCAILDDGSVRCWGYGAYGQLGYDNAGNVGDGPPEQSIISAGPVDLGGPKALAISAGGMHTCAVLDDGTVRCWGYGFDGQLGYGNPNDVGDGRPGDPAVAAVGPVPLAGPAIAIAAGGLHTCAILQDGSVQCWGDDLQGQLGTGATSNLGNVPGTIPPASLGPGRTATAITAGANDTCAILNDGTLRCWGAGAYGELGYGNQTDLGDTPNSVPADLGPVPIGPAQTALAISASANHTCARLVNGALRCWGDGAYGQLGYCSTSNVGDSPTDTPDTAGPVNLEPGGGGQLCPPVPPGTSLPVTPSPPSTPSQPSPAPKVNLTSERERGWRRCLARVDARAHHARILTRHGTPHARARARHRLARMLARGHRKCVNLWGRTPGRVRGLRVLPRSSTSLRLEWQAPGTNGDAAPPADAYLVTESRHPLRDHATALTLCHGSCRFNVAAIGTEIALTITGLRPHTSYYFKVAARDVVSGRPGPRSQTVQARTS